MNKYCYYLILIIYSIFSLSSCSKDKENLKIHIIENEDAVLKYPNSLSVLNDSMLVINDKDNLFLLNRNTGKLIALNENEKYIEECYTAIDNYNYFGGKIMPRNSYCIVSPHVVSIDKNNANVKLVNITTFEQKDSASQIARPAVFVTGGNKVKLLVEKQDSIVMLSSAVPLGNIGAYITDTLVITPKISYFLKNTTPDTVPLLSVFSIDKEGDLSFEKLLYFKYEPQNNLCRPDDEHDDCPCLSTFSFYTDNGKIFFANGINIYEYSNGKMSKLASPAQNKIVSFKFDGDTVYTIEKDTAKIYTANAYSLSTQKPIKCRYGIPAGLNINAINFIGEHLFILYQENDSFYLLTIK